MKRVLGCIRRADERYNMIRPGDKICVGVSGGKDSLLLMYGLKLYQMFSKMPVPTTAIVLHALTKDEVEGRSGRISNMDEIDQFFKKKVAVSVLV